MKEFFKICFLQIFNKSYQVRVSMLRALEKLVKVCFIDFIFICVETFFKAEINISFHVYDIFILFCSALVSGSSFYLV